jgi:DNA-binding IclR family transcriptional regulator
MAVKPPAPADGVGAVDRALSILFVFQPGEASLTLAEIARRTGLYKSTLLRLMASLERARLLLRAGEEARWSLGPALVGLGLRAEAAAPLRALLPPVLRRMAAASGESASFFIRDGAQRLCLMREEGSHAVRDTIRPGSLLPLERGAAGHVLTAARPGLVVTIGERDAELAAVAAPVLGREAVLLGALCLSGTATRLRQTAHRQALEALVLREAEGLSAVLRA